MMDLGYARRAQRRPVDLGCQVIRRGWDEPAAHRLTDLSPYGGWIATAFPLARGEELVMCFEPPRWGGREIQVFAEVTRRVVLADRKRDPHARCGMGVEFMDLGDHDRFELRRWLRDHAEELALDARALFRRMM